MEPPLKNFDHPSWFTAGSTLLAYGVILAGMFVLLFLVPYLIFLGL